MLAHNSGTSKKKLRLLIHRLHVEFQIMQAFSIGKILNRIANTGIQSNDV